MLRGRSIVVALAIFGAVSVCAAQETADIIVGGQIVARVREAGTSESVQHRAAAVDERINQLLAVTDNPASLDVSLEQVDGLWTVVIGGQPIVAVYRSEAEANGVSPEMLGAMWVRKFKDALPNATAAPVTEIPEQPAGATQPAGAPAPIAIADEPVISSPTTGAETVPVMQAPPPAAPVAPAGPLATQIAPGTVEVLEVPQEDGDGPDEVVAGQGARLLILEAFNDARDLGEDDYLIRREAMANDLFNELVQMVSGGRQTGRIEPGATVSLPAPPGPAVTPPAPAPTPVVSPTATATTATAPPPSTGISTVTTPMPSVTGAAPSLAMSPASLTKISAAIPANDVGYANVVKKVAIKAKFRAAADGLRTADPATRAQAMEVLSAARQANTNHEWTTAEQYVDTGLRILGVTQWEQHIDAAMRDLGLVK